MTATKPYLHQCDEHTQELGERLHRAADLMRHRLRHARATGAEWGRLADIIATWHDRYGVEQAQIGGLL